MRFVNYSIAMLLCLMSLGCSSIHDDEEVEEYVRVGDHVPVFTVSVVNGGETTTFSTSNLTGETVIVFFHTSCHDCQRELPKLNEYYLRHCNDQGFQMVAISRGESAETVAPFWEKHGLQIPYSAQTDRHIYNLFASSTIPRVYFVSAQGIVTRLLVEDFDLPE